MSLSCFYPLLSFKKPSNPSKTNELETKLRSVFSSEKTLDVPLGKVIENFQQVKTIDDRLLGAESIFKQVPVLCSKLDLIEKAIDKIVTDLETKKDIDRAYVKSLHGLVRTTANIFDFFGVCIAELFRVEHNFVLVLEKLVNEAAKQ